MLRYKIALAVISLLFFSVLNWNCTKVDTTTIGSGLIPAVDNVNTFDTTLSVTATNFDSIPFGKVCTTVYPTDEHILGTISNDPLFGTTKATIYTELKPDIFPFSFPGTNRTIDSIVLVLSYRKSWGDSTVPQNVTVNAITNNFTPDSSSCSSYAYGTQLGSATYIPQRLNDSVKVGFGDTSTNQLRIKLLNSFGQSLLSQDSSSAFKNDSTFKSFFHGFAIAPGSSGNSLSYFALTDANTKLAVYYKFKNAANRDSVGVVNFHFNVLCASANNIVRNHAGSELSRNLNHPVAGDSLIYIQTTPGTYAEIKIPALTGLSNRIIHRAELIMDQIYDASSFAPPNYLFLDIKNTGDSVYRPIPCDLIVINGQPDLSTFGGYKTTVTDKFGNSIARYVFNISRYVQKIVTNGRANSTLRLRAPDFIINPNNYIDECGQGIPLLYYPLDQPTVGRIKLGGGNNTNYRMRLRIIYSKI